MKHVAGVALAFVLLTSSMGAAFAAAPRPPQASDWKQIRLVVGAQLEAFRRDDARAAYSLASPEIRSVFRTPGEFMRMVRTGYRPLSRPQSVRFLHHFMVAGHPVQALQIVTEADQLIVVYYVMQRQRDGAWKVAGCALERAPATAL
jgi:hypothetical protein